jgi:hypothetical protein
MVGAAVGHWWDDMDRDKETFGSGALYALVVSGILMLFAVLILNPLLTSSPHPRLAFGIVVGGIALFSASSKSLIDDLHHTYFGGDADSDSNTEAQDFRGEETVGGLRTAGSLGADEPPV